MFREMTSRDKAAADLRSAKEIETRTNDLKDRFLLYACHELRSPIHAIAFSCDLLHGSLTGEEEAMRKNISGAVHVMETIAADILDFQLLQSGKFEQNRKAMDMMQILTNLAWMFRANAEEPGKSIAWSVGIRADVPKVVTGDSLRTGAVVNKVQNAFRFTTRHGASQCVAVCRDVQASCSILSCHCQGQSHCESCFPRAWTVSGSLLWRDSKFKEAMNFYLLEQELHR